MDEELAYALIFCTMLFLFLTAVIVAVFFISSKRKAQQEAQLAANLLSYEKELRKVESEVSENLLSNIAQELHDSIGQLHTAMKIQIDNVKHDFPAIASHTQFLESTLSEASTQVRSLGRTLNGDYIGRNGLMKTMEVEVQRLKNLRKFKVEFEVLGDKCPLNNNEELIVFRIFQEFSQNALRHSEAQQFSIKVAMNAEQFVILVCDDGKGFDVKQTLDSFNSSGLSNILSRAKLANFESKITSTPGQGTTFELQKLFSVI